MNAGFRPMPRWLVGLGAAALLVVGASPAVAAPSLVADDTWMTSGKVLASALSPDGGTLYVGGTFKKVQENPTGQPGATVAANNLAAIDVATGTVIDTWTPDVTGTGARVEALVVADGKVFVGGDFAAVNGEPRQNLAAVDAATGVLDPWSPLVGTDTSKVFALLASGTRLYVGGAFGTVDGKSRAKLAAFDLPSLGLSNAWKPRATGGSVRDLEFDTAGATVFLGGAFTSLVQSGTVFPRQSVARVASDTGAVHPWQVPPGQIGNPQTAWDLLATSNTLYGGFGQGPNYVWAFALDNGDTGTPRWPRLSMPGNIQTVALSPDGTRLFFGGHFGLGQLQRQVCSGAQQRFVRGLASLNPANGSLYCDWIPQLAPFGSNFNGPWTMQMLATKLWVGGGWTTIEGIEQRNLARFSV